MTKLVSVPYYRNWLEKTRESNKKYFTVLIKKDEWESFSELAKACGCSVPTISKFLYKLEKEGVVTIKKKRKGDYFNKIVVNRTAWDYLTIWSRYRRLKYLFKEDIKRLLKNLSIGRSAMVVGYKSNYKHRSGGLKEALKRLGWWDEFKKDGII